MSDRRDYDVIVIVIGAGSTGENVADRAVKGGLSAVIVEEDLVGGDCSYWACIPSKALLRPVHALAGAERVAGSREALGGSPRPNAAAGPAPPGPFTRNRDGHRAGPWVGGAPTHLVRRPGRLGGGRPRRGPQPGGCGGWLCVRCGGGPGGGRWGAWLGWEGGGGGCPPGRGRGGGPASLPQPMAGSSGCCAR